MRPARVLHVIETLGYGGAEQQLRLLVGGLDPARFSSTVCHLFPPDPHAAAIRAMGLPVISLELPHGGSSLPRATRALAAVIREVKPDLIHTSLFLADLAGGAAARLSGIPALSTLCNVVDPAPRLADNPRLSAPKLYASLALWGTTLRACHRHAIAISAAVADSAARTLRYPKARMTVIHRAVTQRSPTLSADGRAAYLTGLGLGDADPFLLTVGRLAPQKGQEHLVRALGILAPKYPNLQLAVVGEGWLQPRLTEVAREAGVADRVRFLGRRDDVPDLMTAADVFVFPSLFEGLGVALLEAASLGRPCVASDTGPIPEILRAGQSGLLVPPADVSALAAALDRVLSDPALARRLGEAARADVSARFTPQRMIEATQALYERLSSREA